MVPDTKCIIFYIIRPEGFPAHHAASCGGLVIFWECDILFSQKNMPITSSAKKALRQNARRKERNDARKDSYKSAVKTLRSSISLKKEEEIKKLLSAANKALDKAAKGNTIAKNKASRLKSRLAQLVTRSSKASS